MEKTQKKCLNVARFQIFWYKFSPALKYSADQKKIFYCANFLTPGQSWIVLKTFLLSLRQARMRKMDKNMIMEKQGQIFKPALHFRTYN